ncbi:hypothetical protein AS189_18280 [Arthrobacter alpinus]|uniref:Phosphonate metabolism protein n=1 Tax=Arthrobacter alpinus TaxID=656366 RepID=A0A0S2M374_9MICC|nr:DUF1045 domain-containing protein [Arthrobacter alpinus]ALO68081.1 hypothetical protein AS189_18280 [Arthrobacter alpinus]
MKRYAVYAVPGINAEEAAEAILLRTAVDDWYGRPEFGDLTMDAQRYGFHATLKAPFHLAAGRTETQLCAAADAFAAARGPVVIPAPAPTAMGNFRALVPGRDPEGLAALAADALREFEGFRAPLNEGDIRRRRPELMERRERELFEHWGYPYVLDKFLFHFTLTGDVPLERTAEIDVAIKDHFDGVSGVDVPLTAIAISVEPKPGAAFEILSVHPFAAHTALETTDVPHSS